MSAPHPTWPSKSCTTRTILSSTQAFLRLIFGIRTSRRRQKHSPQSKCVFFRHPQVVAPLDSKRDGFPLRYLAQCHRKLVQRLPPSRDSGRHREPSNSHCELPLRHRATHCHCCKTRDVNHDGEREDCHRPSRKRASRVSRVGRNWTTHGQGAGAGAGAVLEARAGAAARNGASALTMLEAKYLEPPIYYCWTCGLGCRHKIPSVPTQQPATFTLSSRGICRAGRKHLSKTEGVKQLLITEVVR